jgi:hypothetical protein
MDVGREQCSMKRDSNILQSLEAIMTGIKYVDLDAQTRTFLRKFTTSDEAKGKARAASNEYNKRRYSVDPEFRQKINDRAAATHRNRYASDEEYRERMKADRRARYQRQKEIKERASDLALIN